MGQAIKQYSPSPESIHLLKFHKLSKQHHQLGTKCSIQEPPRTFHIQTTTNASFHVCSRFKKILHSNGIGQSLLSKMTGASKRNVHMLVLEGQWMTMMHQLLPHSQDRLLVKISLTNWREPRSIQRLFLEPCMKWPMEAFNGADGLLECGKWHLVTRVCFL